MELYLVQHAEAMSAEHDPTRPLTGRGKQDIIKVAQFVKWLNIRVNTIMHSGELRAEQTARELAKVVCSDMGLKKTAGLAPNDEVGTMRDIMAGLEDNLMIVGHLPYLSKLLSNLICGDQDIKIADFQMGCIVRLDRDNEKWYLRWMITPTILPYHTIDIAP
jgi:phosphohistidine phosphatase